MWIRRKSLKAWESQDKTKITFWLGLCGTDGVVSGPFSLEVMLERPRPRTREAWLALILTILKPWKLYSYLYIIFDYMERLGIINFKPGIYRPDQPLDVKRSIDPF